MPELTAFQWCLAVFAALGVGVAKSGFSGVSMVHVLVFAFLFGLSMDYEVFLLARMREAYDGGADTDAAVITGLSRTGRLVTAAALILFMSFLAMSTAPAVDVRVMATGLGAGILVDATIVRCLLVPALVSLLGRWNWWLPAWAARPLRVAPSPAHRATEPVGPREPVTAGS